MKVLLDTNIVIHREAETAIDPDIGILFKWLDDLQYKKCLHSITVEEIEKYKDPKVVATFKIKLGSYHVLLTKAPLHADIKSVCSPLDKDQNDINDSLLLNEVINNRVDMLITEDKAIGLKAKLLNISDKVFTIDHFLEKVTAENPALKDYRVLGVRKVHFGNLKVQDEFFADLKQDYPGFEEWFNRKSDETAYVCQKDDKLLAFLYLKPESESEDYSDIMPAFVRKKRLKIGTFKVDHNGFKLGERFLKIVFDNALRLKVDDIYVTVFNHRPEQLRLISLLESYGFKHFGHKKIGKVAELVYVRGFGREANRATPRLTFPYVSISGKIFLTPIYPEYHTNLLPDSILRNESPDDYVENEPFRNAISKVFISRSVQRDLNRGDLIVFYRTGGYYESVVSTIGVVEDVVDKIRDEAEFIKLCGKRSVFTPIELSDWWNRKPRYRPFIVNFLYSYSFPKRINLKRLIELNIIPNIESAPRGFTKISVDQFQLILRETTTDESLIVN